MYGRVVLVCVLLAVAAVHAGLQDRATHPGLQDRLQSQDYQLLQEALRLATEKNNEFAALREELNTLKTEVQQLRGGNQAKNDHLTVQWLSGSVTELRAEVAELSASVNRTEELAAREAVNEELRLVRADMSTLRRDVDVLRAEQEARVSVLAEDFQELKARCQVKQPNKESNSILTVKESAPEDNKKFRHQRLLKKRVDGLYSSQTRLEKRLQLLEKKTHTYAPAHYQRVSSNDILESDLTARVVALEKTGGQHSKAIFNVSRQVAGLSKLHVSMLELLESVEALESKVESTVPEFRKEISRLEFSMAQLSSTVSIVREDQENQRSSVKAMAGAMSAMQDKLDQEHSRVKSLESEWGNWSSRAGNLTEREEALTIPQHSEKLPGIISRLTSIIHEYDLIITDLPHECSWVDGPSGLYILAPGPGRPLVTFCDQLTGAGGWTLVQRRQDGSQEFNKKWNDYAEGFGTPLGEFWIGNEALHRLTAANLSSLRIDLVDIYGKAWYAEYDQFTVGNVSDGYRLTVSGYHGNASDALNYQNHMQFSAIDSDRDVSNTHCAANYEGGWWFSHCQHANLNGRYNLGLTWFDASRNEWIAVARSEMKVRSRQRHRTAA